MPAGFGADPVAFAVPHDEADVDHRPTFHLLANLEGFLPLENPWSPVGQRLAFFGIDGGLYVFDATEPEKPSTLVCASAPRIYNHTHEWS